MRTALLCVFLALIIHDGSRASDSDFRPIPIPLDPWKHERREGREGRGGGPGGVGTLHEAIRTDAPPAVAAVPAHYWEDALRHSVYLTLVRDKIDQLISRGVIVSPSSKPEEYVSKEIDDHDLWEKIKKAPFDRLQEDELSSFGDVTVMAKGRLVEDNGGYRFSEDERSREDCSNDKCMEGVKAFWSVKRVRQRDVETSPGKYHYELTFSVNSQPPIKQRKPYETPVRTFTVRENAPDTVVGTPQEHPVYQPARPAPRPQRAVWVHKNISPKHYHHQGRYYQGLDRIFSSFFSDDESPPEPHRYKPYGPPLPPIYSQSSKIGYVGLPSDHHHQKRLMPYPYKPYHVYKYRPPLAAPPISNGQPHYIDVDVVKHPYVQQQAPDHRYISSSNIVKTTRPAVLPTPPMTNQNTTPDDSLETFTNKTVLEETTKMPEMPTNYPTTVYKTYTKQRPVKVNYFSEHIRPPIYNAPPGVFVTMDKKPFKPMPPLKHMHYLTKPPKKPTDFRPSPQLIDGQFSTLETDLESAFRPILPSNETDSDSTEDIEVSNKQSPKRKLTSKKPPKKHENIKWQTTTSGEDIITAGSDSKEEESMEWADVLSAFSKTTPMHSHSDKKFESTTPMSASSKKSKTTTSTTETYEELSTSITTTTAASKKRTRPPHKFVKPEKVKKHKRITTTKAPEQLKKPSDLTPQASSAATNAPKPTWKKNKSTTAEPTTQPSTTTTIFTTTTTTTQEPTTKSAPPVETTTKAEFVVKAGTPKNKNRFRLTTLMQKGTSVKHDRWSTANIANSSSADRKTPTGKHPPRRKGSNFQGYASSSTSKYGTRDGDEFQRQKYTHDQDSMVMSSTETVKVTEKSSTPVQSSFDEIPVYFNVDSTSSYTRDKENMEEDIFEEEDQTNSSDEDAADQSEFIFGVNSSTPSEKVNEISEEDLVITEQTVLTTTLAPPKNKTKCKKKKNHHLAPTTIEPMKKDDTTTQTISTSTKTSLTGINILDDIFDSLSYEEPTEQTVTAKHELEEEESENHEKYLKLDEDFEEFLGNIGDIGGKHQHSDDKDVSDVEYDDEAADALPDDDESPYNNEYPNESERREANDTDYEDYRERSYSLLELMAME